MSNDTKNCPRCKHHGPIERDFGYRVMARRYVRPQSWCRRCRTEGQRTLMGRRRKLR